MHKRVKSPAIKKIDVLEKKVNNNNIPSVIP